MSHACSPSALWEPNFMLQSSSDLGSSARLLESPAGIGCRRGQTSPVYGARLFGLTVATAGEVQQAPSHAGVVCQCRLVCIGRSFARSRALRSALAELGACPSCKAQR